MAKGARRLKSPFESALDLLALCRIVFLHKSSEALDLLTEAKLLRRFRPAGPNLAGLYAGYYVAELLGEMTDDDDPHPELFDLADETLAASAAGEQVAKRIVRSSRCAWLLGTRRRWILRRVRRPVTPTGRVAFGQLDGGVCVRNVRAGKKQVVRSARACAGDGSDCRHRRHGMAKIADRPARRWVSCAAILNSYCTHLLGRRPRLHEYLGQGCP